MRGEILCSVLVEKETNGPNAFTCEGSKFRLEVVFGFEVRRIGTTDFSVPWKTVSKV